MKRKDFGVTMLAAAACGVATPSSATTTPPPDRDQEIKEIRAEMQALEKRLDALQSPVPPAPENSGDHGRKENQTAAAPPPTPSLGNGDTANPGTTATSLSTVATQPPGPSGKALGNAASSFDIQGSSSGGNATVTIGNYSKLRPIGQSGWMNVDSEEIILSAPLAKGGGTTAITALDGLASGGEIKFKWTRYARRVGPGILSPDLTAKLQNAINQCSSDPLHKMAAADCTKPENRQEILQQYDPGDWPSFRKTVDPSPIGYAFGIMGGVGYTSYTYINTETVKSTSAGRTSWEAGPFFSLLPNYGAPSSITLSYTYQHAYQDAKSGVACPLSVGSGSNYNACQSGPIGLPASNNKNLIGLDYRIYLPKLPIVGIMAISPQFTYDFNAHYKAIDFPIYVAHDTTGSLIGGIDLGYSTQDHQFLAGVFIGAPFSIFH